MSVLEQILSGQEENHILPFFWQHGEDEATLREYMNVIHNDNIGAVCIESRPHPDFCGPKWWHDMDIILDEAKKLGMQVWILDDSHFPTGYANGALNDAPENLCRESMDVQYIDVPEDQDHITIDMTKYQSAAPWTPTQIEGYIMREGYPYTRKFASTDVLSAVAAIRMGGHGPEDIIDLTERAKNSASFTFVEPALPHHLDEAETQGKAAGPLPEEPGKKDAESEGAGTAAGTGWRIAICHRTHNRGPHRNYINMMQAKSVRILIDSVYEKHYEHYSSYFGNVIAGFFSDEPEIGNGHLYEFGKKIGEGSDQAWSPEVEEDLRKLWEEDYPKFVPLIWNQDFDEDLQAKVRVDYMNVVTRLVEKDFSFQIGNWCRAHGVKYIGHLIEDDHQHTRTGSSLGHYFLGLAGQDMAGVDDIGGQVLPQGETIGKGDLMHPIRDGEFWHYTLGKLGGSLAALDPLKKGRAMCELFGNYGWAEGVQLEKYIADHLITKGINYFVPHAFTAAPFPDPDCPPHFYAHGHNPQYRHFGYLMKYMNRAATLLSGGKPVIPCAVLYNGESDWAGKTMYLQKVGIELYDHQLDYLFVPNDAFLEEKYQAQVGKILTVNGNSFPVFIIPEVEYIPRTSAQAAVTMAKAGGEVIFINALPDATIEGGHKDPILEELKSLSMHRKNDIKNDTEENAGTIKILPLEQLADTLINEGFADARITPADNRIRIYHYQHDGDIYMVINEGTKTWNGRILVPEGYLHDATEAAAGTSGQDSVVCLYDAWDNTLVKVNAKEDTGHKEDGMNTGIGEAQSQEDAAGAMVPISLDPRKSIFILTGVPKELADQYPSAFLLSEASSAQTAGREDNSSVSGPDTSMDWSDGWKHSICHAVDYPKFEEEKMISLPDNLAEEKPEFSGFVRYEKILTVQGDSSRQAGLRTILEITDAREGVEVFVNGHSLGIQIVPTYRYDLTPFLKEGDNEICIEVATTLERESVNYPNRWAALGVPRPTVTVPSGICGRVVLNQVENAR